MSQARINRRVREAQINPDDYIKTSAMFQLERKYNRNIRDLLAEREGTGVALGRRYAVSTSAICRWRKRLGIVVRENSGQFTEVV